MLWDVYSLISSNNDKVKIIPLNIKSEIIEKNDIKRISMKDGTMNFDIIDKDKVFLKAIAKDTGVIRGGKGCNIPGAYLGEDSLNDKELANTLSIFDILIYLFFLNHPNYQNTLKMKKQKPSNQNNLYYHYLFPFWTFLFFLILFD